jgi:hypothetical protein
MTFQVKNPKPKERNTFSVDNPMGKMEDEDELFKDDEEE